MPLRFCCPCGKTLRVGDHLAGKRVKCPSCGQMAAVPTSNPSDQADASFTSSPRVSPWIWLGGVGAAVVAGVILFQVFRGGDPEPPANPPVVIGPEKTNPANNQGNDQNPISQDKTKEAKKEEKKDEVKPAPPTVRLVKMEPEKPVANGKVLLTLAGDHPANKKLKLEYRLDPKGDWREAPQGAVAIRAPHSGHLFLEARAVDEQGLPSTILERRWEVAAPPPEPVGLLRQWDTHPKGFALARFHPQTGDLLTAADERGNASSLLLTDLDSGKVVQRYANARPAWFPGVSFTPDGKRLAALGPGYQVGVWDVASGKELAQFKEHKDGVRAVAISPDGQRVLSAGGRIDKDSDIGVRLWNVETQEAQLLEGHQAFVNCAAFSPDGNQAMTGGHDKTVWLWDAASGAGKPLAGHSFGVQTVAFSSDGQSLLSASHGADNALHLSTVIIWDRKTLKETRRFNFKGGFNMLFSPDGKRLLAGDDNDLTLWDVPSGKEVHRYEGHTAPIATVEFSPDGRRAISGAPNELRLWSLPDPKFSIPDQPGITRRPVVKVAKQWKVEDKMALRVACTADGRQVLSTGFAAGVHISDLKEGKEVRQVRLPDKRAWGIAVSSDNQLVLTAGEGEAVCWELGTGKVRHVFKGLDYDSTQPLHLALSQDASRGFALNYSHRLHMWDLKTGKKTREILCAPTADFEGRPCSMAAAADGRWVVTGHGDRTLRIWDMEDGKMVKVLGAKTPFASINFVTFNPEGKLIASQETEEVHLWDRESGALVRKFIGHSGGVTCCSFSADGLRLATGSHDHTVRLWDVASGRMLHRIDLPGQAHSLSLTPDGRRVVVSCMDPFLRLYELP